MITAPKTDIRPFFDEATNTVSYLVGDPQTRTAAVIDRVLDFDSRSGDRILAASEKAGLIIVWVIETHAHADHLSAATYLKLKTGAKVGIGEHIREVQRIFRPIFNLPDISGAGSEFDHLFEDGKRFHIGSLEVEVLHTPGHTPASVSYKIGDAVFVGDTLFTGRDSYAWETTVAEEKARNVHVREGVSEDEFVAMREARDAKLETPLLLLPSIQVNIRAGRLPTVEQRCPLPEDSGEARCIREWAMSLLVPFDDPAKRPRGQAQDNGKISVPC